MKRKLTFANAVTQVGMPQANLTALLLGPGGATADATSRLSANTPNVLLNNAGASIDVTVASLQNAADRLTSALTETREMIVAEPANSAQLEARVRTLENSATRQDVRFDALPLSINELKQQARETNALLRELAQRP